MRVTLGGFELRDEEKPDFIQLGGKQMLAVRVFPGGRTSIQDFGPDYRPIQWAGFFIGSDAYDRMMSVGLMRTAGKQVEFSGDKFSMPVYIEEFFPDYKHQYRIPFTITLRRVVDDTANKTTDLVDASNPSTDQPAATSQTYVVQQGDTLPTIAAKLTGDPNNWEQIYADNQGVLTEGPFLFDPGIELKINA